MHLFLAPRHPLNCFPITAPNMFTLVIQAQRKMGYGEYREIIESEFLKEVTSLKHVICHFFHDEFQRCKIVDAKLRMIAQAHREVKFIRLNVQKAQFMVQKLQVKTLPTIVLFTDGVAKDRIVGFDELGGKDVFPTRFVSRWPKLLVVHKTRSVRVPWYSKTNAILCLIKIFLNLNIAHIYPDNPKTA